MNLLKGTLIIWLALASLEGAASAARVTVFAAASLMNSLREIAAEHERRTNDRIIFNFAASGTLARQIEEGAPADLFFSADEAKMDALEQKGLLVEQSRRNRLSNSLVIIAASDSDLSIAACRDLADPKVKRIALAHPKTSPVGFYAWQHLEKLQLWPAVQPKVIFADNARAILAAVEAGNVDAGIVYATDAAVSRKVRAAYELPRAEGPKIVYSMALVKNSPQPEAARKFLSILASEKAGQVFKKHGFIVLETPPIP